jgi:hypothetical protein
VDLGFRQRDADAEHPAPLVGADANRGEDGCVANDAACADLLVPCVKDQVADLAERTSAPRFQFVVEQGRGAADWEEERPSIPNSRSTASAWRVETPFTYISATVSMTARTERQPRSTN